MRPLFRRVLLTFVFVAAGACTGVGGTSSAPTTTTPPGVPSGSVLVEDLPIIEVLGPGEGHAGEAPLFTWVGVDGVDRYRLVVVGIDGPQWAWTGTETEIYFGGFSIERPPGWRGITLEEASCWSVAALDGDGRALAVSRFLPVSPGESQGHACVPGSGS